MKLTKGILIGILIIAGMIGGGWYFLNTYYKTTDYYVKITTDPVVKKEKASDGITDTFYSYKVSGFEKNGKERKLNLESQDTMKKNQYYLIHWEDRRGIISSKENVSKKDIPAEVLKKLD